MKCSQRRDLVVPLRVLFPVVLDEFDIPFVWLGCNAEGNDERDMSGGGFRTLWGFGKI
jgi:hypothetical protein